MTAVETILTDVESRVGKRQTQGGSDRTEGMELGTRTQLNTKGHRRLLTSETGQENPCCGSAVKEAGAQNCATDHMCKKDLSLGQHC